jgi:hypothetical protein
MEESMVELRQILAKYLIWYIHEIHGGQGLGNALISSGDQHAQIGLQDKSRA